MKQFSIITCALCLLVACNTATNSSETKDTATTAAIVPDTNQNVTYAYPIEYSSDFTIGDSKLAQTVLELWKDYDNNAFDNHTDAFSDSVIMDLAGGQTIKGKDSALAGVKRYRSSLQNAVSSVEVVTTLKPKGKDESWVCVWGKEVDTHKNGKKDSVYINENWMFDKNGKVAYMSQFQATPPKPMKK
jgi:hypothetical protein